MENQNSNVSYQEQPPVYTNPATGPASYVDAAPLSIGNYLVMMIISVIPIVNLVSLFIWGFGNSNLNRKNFARAQLIVLAIVIVISIIFGTAVAFTSPSLTGK